MTKNSIHTNHFIIPITALPIGNEEANNEVFQHLLVGKTYIAIGNQILFEKDGQFFLTMIDNTKHHYTIKDYQKLPFKAPYQLIDGNLQFMPSPLYKHQDTIANLNDLLRPYVKENKLGKVQFAPLDVHFDDENIFQPDLMFISNERIDIIKDFIHGAPDLIVEVLSSNKSHDLGKKKEAYGKFNVIEYWAIDYNEKTLKAYLNEDQKMILKNSYEKEDEVKSVVLDGFSFTLSKIFE